MAKYKATQGYAVAVGDKTVRFGWLGEYETNDKAEIAVLDGLAPKWIKRVDEPEVDVIEKPEDTPKATPAQRNRKASAK